jgi:hypothetical protein
LSVSGSLADWQQHLSTTILALSWLLLFLASCDSSTRLSSPQLVDRRTTFTSPELTSRPLAIFTIFTIFS